MWTGKQIFSLIIPVVNMRRESKRYKADIENEDKNITVADTIVLVEQGELLTGILDKNTLGASNGSLIHIIQNEHGPQVCEEKKKNTVSIGFFHLLCQRRPRRF